MLVRGPKDADESWDAPWRRRLVDNLERLVQQLCAVRITRVYADGSFVENTEHPNDIDGYFDCEPRRLADGSLLSELNALDPYRCWTWDPASRKPFGKYSKSQLPMWHRYRVELYPNWGQMSGILDKHGRPMDFPTAFRRSRRTGLARGILLIESDA